MEYIISFNRDDVLDLLKSEQINESFVTSYKDYPEPVLENPIRYAALTQKWKILLRLLEFENLNVDYRPEVTDDDSIKIKLLKSMTALILASKDNNHEVVQALLKAGSNPELKDSFGYCALYHAAVDN